MPLTDHPANAEFELKDVDPKDHPDNMLLHHLLGLIRMCDRDNVGNVDMQMKGVTVNGRDAGAWRLRLEKTTGKDKT